MTAPAGPSRDPGLRLGRAEEPPVLRARQRLLALAFVFAGAFGVVAVRLAEVSLVAPVAAAPAEAAAPGAPVRGEILDRNGVVLAASVPSPSLYADPRLVDDPERLVAGLARVFPGLDREAVARRLADRSRAFVWIRRHVAPADALRAHRLGDPALGIREEWRRVYPQGRLLSHAVGFAGIDGGGQAGVERYRDALLAGGRPVRLAVDVRVQYAVRARLADALERFGAKAAAGIVLDIATGGILAIASLPDFDPNAPIDVGDPALFDRASQGVYEMGSTFKAFTLAAALDSGAADLQSRFDATRPIRVASHTIHDYRPESRWLSLPEVLVHSSNIAAVRVGQALGPDRLWTYLAGLGLLTEVLSPAVRSARPLLPAKWGPVETATVSFGHGISVSPLQVAAGFAALANGGLYRAPTLLWEEEPTEPRAVFSPGTSAAMRDLLRLVVLRGSGRRADVGGYRLGGKTGTAQKVVDGRYDDARLVTSFAGAFPTEAPRYAVVVVLDEPGAAPGAAGATAAGWNAAPVAGAIVAGIAPILDVAPRPEGPAEIARVAWR